MTVPEIYRPDKAPLRGDSRDALLPGTCRRCGFVADHPTPADCINALRDRIAELTTKETVRRPSLKRLLEALPSRAGPYRTRRSFARYQRGWFPPPDGNRPSLFFAIPSSHLSTVDRWLAANRRDMIWLHGHNSDHPDPSDSPRRRRRLLLRWPSSRRWHWRASSLSSNPLVFFRQAVAPSGRLRLV